MTIPATFLTLGVLVVIVLYIFGTLRLVRKRASILWVPALIILVCATVLYWQAYAKTGAENKLSRLILSLSDALNLFVFKLSTSPSDFFFVKDGMSAAQAATAQQHLVILNCLSICAIWTTSILIVYFFAQRFSSRLWLWFHRPNKQGSHIFLGTDRYALTLAKDIYANDKSRPILFVDFPTRETMPSKVSVLELFRGIKTQSAEVSQIRRVIPSATVLSAKHNPGDCSAMDLFSELGLGRLKEWLALSSTNVYILSDDLDGNMALLQKIEPSDAHIYVRAPRIGLNRRIELVTNRNVQLIDQSLLTSRRMKMKEELQPVRYLHCALDRDGQPLGWVETPLNALLLGFGYVGRGALSFLYEFGNFVGEDGKELPMRCEIIDRHALSAESDFRLTHPGVPSGKVVFIESEIGSEHFWTHFSKIVQTLNYIVIALGDDDANVKTGLDIIDQIARRGLSDRICLVIRLKEPEKYQHLIDDFQQSIGVDCIHLIGGLVETWTTDNIVDERFEAYAKHYYEAYCLAAESSLSWEERLEVMKRKETFPVWKKVKLRRMVQQDYANYLHEKVKKRLMPERFVRNKDIAASIPAIYNGFHTSADPDTAKRLEYLAIGEHIRWMASLQMDGYCFGPEKRYDLKTHPSMKSFEDLSEQEKHFNYLVVKTAIMQMGD